jgi:hypothetical protein
MRQFGDTLAWFGMIMVVAAVLYFTPRLKHYVAASMASEHGAECETCRELTCHQAHGADAYP